MARGTPEELWGSHVFWTRWGPGPPGVPLETPGLRQIGLPAPVLPDWGCAEHICCR